jgi:peptidoglycan/xylan/chitin deacetylase (PgdA/CDA1 family)
LQADPKLFDYWPYDNRPKIVWPDGARIAVWVVPNIEFYELSPAVNPVRPSWPVPVPDVNGYSARDYGNRVGHMRMMRLLDDFGIRGSISLSTAVCEHHPEIIALCKERDWEFFSHGIYNTRYTYGMSEEQERSVIQDAVDTIASHTGQHCDGYLTPALTHSEHTMDLFAEAGGTYSCDLFHDDQPTPIHVRSGKKFVSVPYSMELNDFFAFIVNKQSPRQFADMIKSNFDRLYAEGGDSGTVLCISLHAYLISQPHRLHYLRKALEHIAGHDDVWFATGREIAHHYIDNYYDAALAQIGAITPRASRTGTI